MAFKAYNPVPKFLGQSQKKRYECNNQLMSIQALRVGQPICDFCSVQAHPMYADSEKQPGYQREDRTCVHGADATSCSANPTPGMHPTNDERTYACPARLHHR